jgi:hypothetical protein
MQITKDAFTLSGGQDADLSRMSLGYMTAPSGLFKSIVSMMAPPSTPRRVSSTAVMWSFGRWIGLSPGSTPDQSRHSRSKCDDRLGLDALSAFFNKER